MSVGNAFRNSGAGGPDAQSAMHFFLSNPAVLMHGSDIDAPCFTKVVLQTCHLVRIVSIQYGF